jgi:uncharacterized membrane protein
MAFCGKCGTQTADGVAFCPNCGAAIGAAAAPVYSPAPTTDGLQENVAGLLCYLVGWLTGLIFFLIDKRPFVRFHAAQSMVVFGALFVFRIILTFLFLAVGFTGMWALHSMLSLILSLVTLVAWVGLMVVAYQGKKFEVPIAAGIAKNIAGQ